MESEKPTVKIGEILLQCGLVTEGELEEALHYGVSRQMRLGEALVELGFIDQNRLGWALSLQFDLSYVDVQSDMVDWDLLATMPLERLEELRMVPLSRVGTTVTAVIADPTMKGLFHVMAELFPHDNVTVQLATEEAIDATLMEAKRRRGNAAMVAPPEGGQEEGLEKLFATLAAGDVSRVVLVRDGEASAVAVLHDGQAAGEASAEVLEQISQHFLGKPLREAPKAFTGLRPGSLGDSALPIRAVHLRGLTGSLTALAVVPRQDAEPSPGIAASEIAHADRAYAAAIALQELSRFAIQNGSLAIAIAPAWHVVAPDVFQVEIADGGELDRFVELTLMCFAPRVLLAEGVYFRRFTAAPGAGTSFLLVKDLGPRHDEQPADAEALRLRVREILGGGIA